MRIRTVPANPSTTLFREARRRRTRRRHCNAGIIQAKSYKRFCHPYLSPTHTLYYQMSLLSPALHSTKATKLTYNVSEMDLLQWNTWLASMSVIPRAYAQDLRRWGAGKGMEILPYPL